MSKIVDITTKIKQKVSEVSAIKNTYDYEKAIEPSVGFPIATVTFKSGEGEFLTTAHNLRNDQFFIRVYQEKSQAGAGSNKAERVSRELLDELLTAFDMDTTLSGTVKYVRPISWDGAYLDRELDVRILEVVVQATHIVTSI